MDELVLGIPRERLPRAAAWRGVLAIDPTPVVGLIEREGTYRTRVDCEDDPSWKQVIPYLVLRRGDELFLMKRTRAGADQRLHDRYSIGIGGHVGPDDGGIDGGLRREWHEELVAADPPRDLRFLGLLNDDSDPVGAVHLGFVYVVETAGEVAIRETHKLSGRFATPDEALGVHQAMETWSQLVFDVLTGRAPFAG